MTTMPGETKVTTAKPAERGGHPGSSPEQTVGILFTAFEPSGDNLAAPVIAEILKAAPHLTVYAWGGPKMAAAGATIIERTADDGAMGLGAWRKASMVRRERARIKRWLTQYRISVHVPVDSPAANFPICKVTRKAGARIVHLVAPQVWAWGRWRVRKLRRMTSLVLCLLPFEEEWFERRKVPAKFIGHPAINREIDEADIRDRVHGLPQGAPRIAIFPGSRSHEVAANIRLLMAIYSELQGRYSGCTGVIVAAKPELGSIVRRKIKVFPTGLHMTTGHSEVAIAWCDLALTVSGTMTLDIARHRKPMIGVYKTGWLQWLGAKLMIRSPYKLLPNIICNREIVPEFVPWPAGPLPIVKHAHRYLQDSKNSAVQSEELARMCLRFARKHPAKEAAAHILGVMNADKAG